MYVIVTKEKNKKMPSRETLYQCFSKNPHDCGFMYAVKNHVYIKKGFMDFDLFYNRITKLDKQIDLTKNAIIMHFRISTSGKIDEENCHPYPITSNLRDTRSTFLKCDDIAFCHNGIIKEYVTRETFYRKKIRIIFLFLLFFSSSLFILSFFSA